MTIRPRKTNDKTTILVESDLTVKDILLTSQVKKDILTTYDKDGKIVFRIATGTQSSLSDSGMVLPIANADKAETLKVEFEVSYDAETLPYYVVELRSKVEPIFEEIKKFVASVKKAGEDVEYA